MRPGVTLPTLPSLFLWTHYYEPSLVASNAGLRGKFVHTLYRQECGPALDWMGYCGGSERFSYWLGRDDILAALVHFGLTDVPIGFEQPDHPNGPSFALVALRT
jgi:hypothetical protein